MLSQAPGPVITIEGIVIDVIIHREPKAPPQDGVPEFVESAAMIDTGASDTCIDYRLAHALQLRQIDQRTIGTVGGPIQVAVFLGVLDIPQLNSDDWIASSRQGLSASTTASWLAGPY